jgi:hypothetical protein
VIFDYSGCVQDAFTHQICSTFQAMLQDHPSLALRFAPKLAEGATLRTTAGNHSHYAITPEPR